jgi:hypothetical protein
MQMNMSAIGGTNMRGYTFKTLAEEVLRNSREPLTAEEIWQEAERTGVSEKVGTHGKTPERSIGAQIYTDIRDNGDNSRFVQPTKHPVMFGLKTLESSYRIRPGKTQAAEREPRVNGGFWREIDLHPLLTTFVVANEHFRCKTKTISEKKSKRGPYKNANEWTHPDIVGAYFPFDDYEASTLKLIEAMRENPYTIFSFEMKKEIKPSELREYYFQAVSNSSWANEGYLVAADISFDTDFREDMQRLVNAFGIGVIRLDVDNIEQSEILFPARHRDNLDWATVDRIAGINTDFRDFIDDVVADAQNKRVRGRYDKPIPPEDYDGYVRDHHLSLVEA